MLQIRVCHTDPNFRVQVVECESCKMQDNIIDNRSIYEMFDNWRYLSHVTYVAGPESWHWRCSTRVCRPSQNQTDLDQVKLSKIGCINLIQSNSVAFTK